MKYLLIILIVISSKLYSQDKKIIYLNEIYHEVDKDQFIKGKTSPEYIDLYFESDSLIQGLLVRRQTIGKLNSSQLSELKKNLLIKENNDSGLIVIIYYPGKDNCNSTKKNSTWNIFDRDYLWKLKRISDISHHWIYKDDEDLKYYYSKSKNWRKDTNQFIESLFFKYHFPCFSCVVIDSNGNFITNYGEFGKDTVWDISKKLKTLN